MTIQAASKVSRRNGIAGRQVQKRSNADSAKAEKDSADSDASSSDDDSTGSSTDVSTSDPSSPSSESEPASSSSHSDSLSSEDSTDSKAPVSAHFAQELTEAKKNATDVREEEIAIKNLISQSPQQLVLEAQEEFSKNEFAEMYLQKFGAQSPSDQRDAKSSAHFASYVPRSLSTSLARADKSLLNTSRSPLSARLYPAKDLDAKHAVDLYGGVNKSEGISRGDGAVEWAIAADAEKFAHVSVHDLQGMVGDRSFLKLQAGHLAGGRKSTHSSNRSHPAKSLSKNGGKKACKLTSGLESSNDIFQLGSLERRVACLQGRGKSRGPTRGAGYSNASKRESKINSSPTGSMPYSDKHSPSFFPMLSRRLATAHSRKSARHATDQGEYFQSDFSQNLHLDHTHEATGEYDSNCGIQDKRASQSLEMDEQRPANLLSVPGITPLDLSKLSTPPSHQASASLTSIASSRTEGNSLNKRDALMLSRRAKTARPTPPSYTRPSEHLSPGIGPWARQTFDSVVRSRKFADQTNRAQADTNSPRPDFMTVSSTSLSSSVPNSKSTSNARVKRQPKGSYEGDDHSAVFVPRHLRGQNENFLRAKYKLDTSQREEVSIFHGFKPPMRDSDMFEYFQPWCRPSMLPKKMHGAFAMPDEGGKVALSDGSVVDMEKALHKINEESEKRKLLRSSSSVRKSPAPLYILGMPANFSKIGGPISFAKRERKSYESYGFKDDEFEKSSVNTTKSMLSMSNYSDFESQKSGRLLTMPEPPEFDPLSTDQLIEMQDQEKKDRHFVWELGDKGAKERLGDREAEMRDHTKSYWNQTDSSFEAPEMIVRRRMLKSSERIKTVVSYFWLAHDCIRTRERGWLLESDYTAMYLKIAAILHPNMPKSQVLKSARRDWLTDTFGMRAMSYEQFFGSMFELADTWTDTIEEDAYVEFLWRLFYRITKSCEAPPENILTGEMESVLEYGQDKIDGFSPEPSSKLGRSSSLSRARSRQSSRLSMHSAPMVTETQKRRSPSPLTRSSSRAGLTNSPTHARSRSRGGFTETGVKKQETPMQRVKKTLPKFSPDDKRLQFQFRQTKEVKAEANKMWDLQQPMGAGNLKKMVQVAMENIARMEDTPSVVVEEDNTNALLMRGATLTSGSFGLSSGSHAESNSQDEHQILPRKLPLSASALNGGKYAYTRYSQNQYMYEKHSGERGWSAGRSPKSQAMELEAAGKLTFW